MRFIALLCLMLPTLAFAGPKGLPAPGAYECRIDAGYKFKPCTIKALPNGGVVLDVTPGLFGITGQIISDEKGRSLIFVGKLSEPRPFGCFSCAPRCAEKPGSCACTEYQPAASNACRDQPIVFPLKKRGKTLTGSIPRFTVEADYQSGKMTSNFPQLARFKFTLRPKR